MFHGFTKLADKPERHIKPVNVKIAAILLVVMAVCTSIPLALIEYDFNNYADAAMVVSVILIAFSGCCYSWFDSLMAGEVRLFFLVLMMLFMAIIAIAIYREIAFIFIFLILVSFFISPVLIIICCVQLIFIIYRILTGRIARQTGLLLAGMTASIAVAAWSLFVCVALGSAAC